MVQGNTPFANELFTEMVDFDLFFSSVRKSHEIEFRASLPPTSPEKKRKTSEDTELHLYQENGSMNNCNFLSDTNWLNTPQTPVSHTTPFVQSPQHDNALSMQDSCMELFEEDLANISSVDNFNFLSDTNWLNTQTPVPHSTPFVQSPQHDNALSMQDSCMEYSALSEEENAIISSEDNAPESEDADFNIMDTNIHDSSSASDIQSSFLENLLLDQPLLDSSNNLPQTVYNSNFPICSTNFDIDSSYAESSHSNPTTDFQTLCETNTDFHSPTETDVTVGHNNNVTDDVPVSPVLPPEVKICSIEMSFTQETKIPCNSGKKKFTKEIKICPDIFRLNNNIPCEFVVAKGGIYKQRTLKINEIHERYVSIVVVLSGGATEFFSLKKIGSNAKFKTLEFNSSSFMNDGSLQFHLKAIKDSYFRDGEKSKAGKTLDKKIIPPCTLEIYFMCSDNTFHVARLVNLSVVNHKSEYSNKFKTALEQSPFSASKVHVFDNNKIEIENKYKS